MHKSRFSFYILLMGIVNCQSIYAMESIDVGDKSNDTMIEMSAKLPWPTNYIKDVMVINGTSVEQIRLQFKQNQYLPSNVSLLEHVLYLSTINRDNFDKTLFTQKQQNKFDTAIKVKRSVPWGFFLNGLVIGITAVFPFTNFVGLLQCSNATQEHCLSQVSTIAIPTITSMVGAFAVGFISLYATGISPDMSSRKANKVQDEIVHLSRKYATLAKYLIDIYFVNEKQAEYIAHSFNFDELKLRARQKTHKAKLGNSLVSPLEEAVHYIKTKTILITFTDIENYIYSKINYRQITEVYKRTEFLENRIKLLENKNF